MKIIIAGCGKIGTSMVEDLVAEGHDILVIDNDESVIRDITNIHDVMGVCGNCVDSDVLEDANVRAAELYIAVTDSD